MDLLINRLSHKEDSALFKEINGEIAEWSLDSHLLAHVINSLRVLDYHLVCANSEHPDRIEKPQFFKPPGAEKAAEQVKTEEKEGRVNMMALLREKGLVG